MRSDQTAAVPLRLGIVGLGRAAVSFLPSLTASPRIEIVAAADSSQQKRDRFAADFGVETFSTAEALFSSDNVDAVYIATPHQFHADQTCMAVSYGKHVLVEKPIALTLRDGIRMVEAAERSGQILMVGPTHGYDLPVISASRLISSGQFGSLRLISTWNYTDFLYRPRRPEELQTEMGGGIMFNQLPHQIDMIRTIAAGHQPASVVSVTGAWDHERPTEGSCVALIRFDSGCIANIVYSGYAHFDSDEICSWIDESGHEKDPHAYGQARRRLLAISSLEEEAQLKEKTGYGGEYELGKAMNGLQQETRYAPHFGVLIASCDGADIRLMGSGLDVYANDRRWTLGSAAGVGRGAKSAVIDELCDAVQAGKRPMHDGRFGVNTLACSLAALLSARAAKEMPITEVFAAEGVSLVSDSEP